MCVCVHTHTFFSQYVGIVHERNCKMLLTQFHHKLQYLIYKKFGCSAISDIVGNVLNLSSYQLSPIERAILDHGLDFPIPPVVVRRKEIFSEFKILNAQIQRLKPVSDNKVRDLKARLNDLTHCYARTPISYSEFKWRREHYSVIKSLRQNKSLVTTRPDKGSGVVVLNRCDCVDKMMTILSDSSKFIKLGPVDSFDSTRSP